MAKHLLSGHAHFRTEYFAGERAFLRQLAAGVQSPSAMYIGCSDSRVIPELLTSSGPGELFVVRNVANLVPPFTHSGVSVGAAVEYALTVLRVPHIIVCGHDGCGGIRASLDGLDKVAHLPSLHTWLEIASPAVAHARRTQLQGAELLRMAVEENVLYQMEHLITYPAVSAALEANTVQLHGWVFDMAEGTVRVYDVNREEFLRPDQLNTQTHIAAQP